MTARALCPDLTIVSRADHEAVVPKLLRAGATRTLSPYAIAGGRIAEAVLRPAVFDFLDDLVGRGHPDLQHPDLRMDEELVPPAARSTARRLVPAASIRTAG
jgi:voltage-gated potassium channel